MREQRSGGFRPDEPDHAELGARLETVLREELGRGHVDVAQLLRDTRQTSRRARVRRTALIAAAAVAVAGVPVAYQALDGPLPGRGVPVASGNTPPTIEPEPTTSPTPKSTVAPDGRPAKPSPTRSPGDESSPGPEATPPLPSASVRPRELDGPTDVLYEIPDEAALRARDLPASMELAEGLDGHYRNGPTIMGQGCGDVPESRWPVTRRTWSWAEENSNRLDQVTVDQVVTGWNDAGAAFNSLVSGTGACRFLDELDVLAQTDYRWEASTTTSEGLAVGFAAERLPTEMVVALTVYHPKGPDVAAAEAARLLDLAVQRAHAAGLVGD